jgi:ABC-type taurine transport system ATPase subunit
MLFVIVGARGAGKTTLLENLKAHGVIVLKPSTTRAPRFEGDAEYDFVDVWNETDYAWKIPVGNQTYGMRLTELAKAERDVCVTVFEPTNIAVFEEIRAEIAGGTATIGLATISDIAEQHRRVQSDPKRLMDAAGLEQVAAIVAKCDIVLEGDAETIAAAALAIIQAKSKN